MSEGKTEGDVPEPKDAKVPDEDDAKARLRLLAGQAKIFTAHPVNLSTGSLAPVAVPARSKTHKGNAPQRVQSKTRHRSSTERL